MSYKTSLVVMLLMLSMTQSSMSMQAEMAQSTQVPDRLLKGLTDDQKEWVLDIAQQHEGEVIFVAFSPDNSFIVMQWEGTQKVCMRSILYSIEADQFAWLACYNNAISDITFSNDLKSVMIKSRTKMLGLFATANGKKMV